jgi:hypothetical protein
MYRYLFLFLLVWINPVWAHHAEDSGLILAALDHIQDEILDNSWAFFLAILASYYIVKRYYQVKEAVETELKIKKLHATLEEHNGMYYLFDKDKSRFLTQAKTYEECEQFLINKYQNTLILITSKDKDLIKRLKGTS